MQGDFLSMISYGIGILPLINNLKQERTEVTHSWCADADGALGTNQRIETYFNLLTRQGPGRGYYPELSKLLLIVYPENLETINCFDACQGFQFLTGAHYLQGYIGAGDSKSDCLIEHMLTWEKNIHTISKTAGKYPQESYSAVARVIQLEWIFLQRLTWDTEDTFAGVEKIILETFLPRLLFSKTKTLSHIIVALSMIPVQGFGLGLLNPVTSVKENTQVLSREAGN